MVKQGDSFGALSLAGGSFSLSCTPPFFPQILATHNRSIFITK
jgi:hypothetical protein